MTNTTFTMRIESKLKEDIQQLADRMGMSSSALVQLVLRSFIAKPKLEVDLTQSGWNDSSRAKQKTT